MDLTREQTEAIIKNGKLRGLTTQGVLDTLIEEGYRPEGIDVDAVKKVMAQTKPTGIEETQTIGERVMGGIKERGEAVAEAITGTGKYEDRSIAGRVVGGTAELAKGISTTAYNALPDKLRGTLDKIGGGIGKGFEYLTDKLSESKLLQDAVASGETKKLEEALQIASDLGIIAGEAIMAKGAVSAGKAIDKGITKAIDVTKQNVMDIAKSPEMSIYPAKITEAVSEKITKIDPKVKNVLQKTSLEKFDRYVKAGEEAMENPRALTPLEKAGEVIDNQVLPIIKEDLAKIGSQKAKSLAPVGTQKLPNVATDSIDFIRSKTQGMKLTTAERSTVNKLVAELEKLGKNPTLASTDKTVDLLQSTLFEKTRGVAIPTTTRVKSLVNQTIGKLNNSVKAGAEKALGSSEFSVLNASYAEKINLFNKLNKIMGEGGIRGGSVIKRFFSPQDSGIKNLFADINKLYGIDLAQDATIAKFVMDSLGDVRSASLLEQIPLSKSGLVTKAMQEAEKYLTRPLPKARKIISESLTQ